MDYELLRTSAIQSELNEVDGLALDESHDQSISARYACVCAHWY